MSARSDLAAPADTVTAILDAGWRTVSVQDLRPISVTSPYNASTHRPCPDAPEISDDDSVRHRPDLGENGTLHADAYGSTAADALAALLALAERYRPVTA